MGYYNAMASELGAPRKAAGQINGGPVLDATMALQTLGAAARLSRANGFRFRSTASRRRGRMS